MLFKWIVNCQKMIGKLVFSKLYLMIGLARLLLLLVILVPVSCAQVGYIPLSDISIDREVQKQHREAKKFLKKDVRAANSQLPKGDHFMVKGIRTKPSKLPSGDQFMIKGLKRKPSKMPAGDKFQTIKDKSSAAKKRKYKNPKGSKRD
jgi:hypothetical protein